MRDAPLYHELEGFLPGSFEIRAEESFARRSRCLCEVGEPIFREEGR